MVCILAYFPVAVCDHILAIINYYLLLLIIKCSKSHHSIETINTTTKSYPKKLTRFSFLDINSLSMSSSLCTLKNITLFNCLRVMVDHKYDKHTKKLEFSTRVGTIVNRKKC